MNCDYSPLVETRLRGRGEEDGRDVISPGQRQLTLGGNKSLLALLSGAKEAKEERLRQLLFMPEKQKPRGRWQT